jgi:hypothetical protein
MLLLAVFRFGATHAAGRIQYFSGLQVAATSLVAFIAPCRDPAIGAYSFDIPVRKKTGTAGAVTLLDHLGIDVPLPYQITHYLPGPGVVRRIICHTKVIKTDLHSPERLVKMRMEPLAEFTRGHTGFFGTHHHRCPVVVRPADKYHVLPDPPQVPDIEICRYIRPEMSDMAGPVGVRQPACHQHRGISHQYIFWSGRYK